MASPGIPRRCAARSWHYFRPPRLRCWCVPLGRSYTSQNPGQTYSPTWLWRLHQVTVSTKCLCSLILPKQWQLQTTKD